MVIVRRSPQVKWLQWARLAVTLLAGLGLGLILARAMTTVPESRISQEDYVALVSVLYDRERSLSNARDRLRVLGAEDDAKLVSSIANSYVSGIEGYPNDAEYLRQLSIALSRAEASAVQTPVASATAGGQATEPSSGVDWILVVVVALAAMVVVGLLIAVRSTRRPPYARGAYGIGTGDWSSSGDSASRQSREPERRSAARQARASFNLPFFGEQFGGRGSDRESEDSVPEPRTASRVPVQERRRPLAKRSFVSRYRIGDDPFDEVHPILDTSTGVLVGACGLSSALSGRSSEGRGCYAFLVWVHDYTAPQSFKGIGITTRWRIRDKAKGLTAWVESAKVDELAAAETGLRMSVRTHSLDVEITLPEVEYLPDEEGLPDGYFRSLAVSFEVSLLSTESAATGAPEGSSELADLEIDEDLPSPSRPLEPREERPVPRLRRR